MQERYGAIKLLVGLRIMRFRSIFLIGGVLRENIFQVSHLRK